MNTRAIVSNVAGVTFEGRQDIIEMMIGDEIIRLQPEPENQYDPNAIAVMVAFPPEARMPVSKVGYIPRNQAADYAPLMEGEPMQGRVREITGGFMKRDGTQASYGLIIEFEVPTGEE